MKTELFLAYRYLFRGKARHVSFIGVISSIGIILGVATVIVACSIVNGIDGGLMERIMRFQYHLTVDSYKEDDLYTLKEIVANWDDVERASLSLETQIFAKFKNNILPLGVKGMDLSDNQEKAFFQQYLTQEKASGMFFVGDGLRRQRGLTLDDDLEFYPLQKKLKSQVAGIRGFFKVGLYDIDNYFLIADIEQAKLLSDNYRFFLGIRVFDPFLADTIKQQIVERFHDKFFVSTWIETNEALFATLKLEKIAMFIILTLIIVIASFNVFATLTVKVVEKTKDIGVLKSLGFSSRKVLSVFAVQGLILGVIGVIGGCALGLGICYFLQRYPFMRLPQEIFFTEYLPVTVAYSDIFWIAIVALIISFVSSLIPAFRASRLQICEALRYE